MNIYNLQKYIKMFFEVLKSYVLRGLALDYDRSRSDTRNSVKEKHKFDCRDVIYKALSAVSSTHGVPSMVRTKFVKLVLPRDTFV